MEIAASDETSYTLALSTWEGLGEEQGLVDLVQVSSVKKDMQEVVSMDME